MMQQLDSETGIATQHMYRISRTYLNYLSTMSWCLDTHRVHHALLHWTCRSLPEWSCRVVQPFDGYRARSIQLRRPVGLEAARCNRNLSVGINELSETGLFEWVEFCHGNEFVAWRYNDDVMAAILDHGAYGLFDASLLPRLTTATSYHVYCLTSLVRRMRRARFAFTVPEAADWQGGENRGWAAMSNGIIRALRTSCDHYGLTACVLLDRTGLMRGIDTVEVRLRRLGSHWPQKSLSRVNAQTAKCLLIDGSSHREVKPADLPDLVGRLQTADWRLGDLA